MCVKSTVISARPNRLRSIDKQGNSIPSLSAIYQEQRGATETGLFSLPRWVKKTKWGEKLRGAERGKRRQNAGRRCRVKIRGGRGVSENDPSLGGVGFTHFSLLALLIHVHELKLNT